MKKIILMRAYDLDDSVKGKRFLVDRIWPRGISKEDLKPFEWHKEIAPTSELRKWFNHEDEKFDDFKKKYLKELNDNSKAKDFLKEVKKAIKDDDIILLYAAKDEEHNNAVVIKKWLEKNLE